MLGGMSRVSRGLDSLGLVSVVSVMKQEVILAKLRWPCIG